MCLPVFARPLPLDLAVVVLFEVSRPLLVGEDRAFVWVGLVRDSALESGRAADHVGVVAGAQLQGKGGIEFGIRTVVAIKVDYN